MSDADIKEDNVTNKENGTEFKKPVLVGKVGRLPRKIQESKESEINVVQQKEEVKLDVEENVEETSQPEKNISRAPAQEISEKSLPLPYKEPSWSGLPQTIEKRYKFEVLKSGKIIEDIDLMNKPFWIFGRLENCDVQMAHPTISRYHAVLQYKNQPSEDQPCGFYLYDLNSTHGTFLNKNRLKPQVYVRVQVGHMINLGCSTRTYLLNGPDDDVEEESELTVTELKQIRAEKLLKAEQEAKELALKEEKEKEEKRLKEERDGIDWGLGEDAEEETDLAENPYAQTNNEELYIDDPKKALRGFMEREGYDLEYDCTEQGMGQFLCKVVLPLDDDKGRPIIAEVLHKGKKKEAVIQCALEACRILDRHGVLRQATHESKKRKAKNWEENDYYDSDDDTYLDRTGTIEKKRENRMKAKLPQQPETYQSLLEKEKKLSEEITIIEKQLSDSTRASSSDNSSNKEEDPLDSFMKELSHSKLDKQKISKLKSDLAKLKVEHAQIIKFVNIARPADLPPLVAQYNNDGSKLTNQKNKGFPLFGKRKKIKVQIPEKSHQEFNENMDVDNEEDEEETQQEQNAVTEEPVASSSRENTQVATSNPKDDGNDENVKEITSLCNIDLQNFNIDMDKFKTIFDRSIPKFKQIEKIIDKIKAIIIEEDKMQMYGKILAIKTKKLMKQMVDLSESGDPKLEYKVAAESSRLLNEINDIIEHKTEVLRNVKQINKEYKEMVMNVKEELTNIRDLCKIEPEEPDEKLSNETGESGNALEEATTSKNAYDDSSAFMEQERKKKKNQRRIQQRNDKAVMEKQKGYEEDAEKEDYNMWVPPTNQTGDGRTSLNDKLGY